MASTPMTRVLLVAQGYADGAADFGASGQVAQARLGVQIVDEHRLARERDLSRDAFAQRHARLGDELIGQSVAGGDGERLGRLIQQHERACLGFHRLRGAARRQAQEMLQPPALAGNRGLVERAQRGQPLLREPLERAHLAVEPLVLPQQGRQLRDNAPFGARLLVGRRAQHVEQLGHRQRRNQPGVAVGVKPAGRGIPLQRAVGQAHARVVRRVRNHIRRAPARLQHQPVPHAAQLRYLAY
jgi:hypothetical protein